MEQQKQEKAATAHDTSAALLAEEEAAVFPVRKVVLSKTGIGYFERYDPPPFIYLNFIQITIK
jgi:hypothetical protein